MQDVFEQQLARPTPPNTLGFGYLNDYQAEGEADGPESFMDLARSTFNAGELQSPLSQGPIGEDGEGEDEYRAEYDEIAQLADQAEAETQRLRARSRLNCSEEELPRQKRRPEAEASRSRPS